MHVAGLLSPIESGHGTGVRGVRHCAIDESSATESETREQDGIDHGVLHLVSETRRGLVKHCPAKTWTTSGEGTTTRDET